MNRRFAFCLFCALCVYFACAREVSTFSVVAEETNPSAERILLLEFTGKNCPACQIIEPLINELERKNYPIQRVWSQNPDDYPIFQKYAIPSTPAFVLLLDGREIDRFVSRGEGMGLLKPQLLRMFEQAAERAKNLPPPLAASSLAAISSAAVSSMTPSAPAALSAPAANPISTPAEIPVAASVSSPEAGKLLRATVRLRIGEPNRVIDSGTGTLVHANEQNGTREGLILTCGHLFRDSGGKGGISVDLFDANGTKSATVTGECIWYDDDLDLGFVGIPLPMPVEPIRLVPPGYLPHAGDSVMSTGCTGGDDPTLWNHTVLSTDRSSYQPKSPTKNRRPFYFLEVANAPKQGRSGGGLFVRDEKGGYGLLGVCNAGDPTQDAGFFLPAPVIYDQLLSHPNLAFVYEDMVKGGLTLVAEVSPDHFSTLPNPPNHLDLYDPLLPVLREEAHLVAGGGGGETIPDPSIRPVHFLGESSALGTSGASGISGTATNFPVPGQGGFGVGMAPGGDATGGEEPFDAGIAELRRYRQEGAEVICIIHWPNPSRESEVIRLAAPNGSGLFGGGGSLR